MAGSDYYKCDFCGQGKIFYDADVNWELFGSRIGQIRAICKSCYENGIRVHVAQKRKRLKVDTVVNWGVHGHTQEGIEEIKRKKGSEVRDD